ncbi:uncharacterized protein PFL1_06293 [Pseudozyma flocculosa PF-1]|uniref:Uncharacterized protein n=2 Tax=Pseudozyma flocculosa TaxID=84751 RepID=A0A5C3F7Z3_9BASI|nr:uncharacterized protein PFL1_06293 [Pseudozyma flocculosa PF-1]EPQ26085.1 hypothetical protein PFL1_06293 [Pseudozyma flocculosa PF-1]SPO40330.1 uncharacterized protein PSFLO_05812 [Pseudozyma flocculosa]
MPPKSAHKKQSESEEEHKQEQHEGQRDEVEVGEKRKADQDRDQDANGDDGDEDDHHDEKEPAKKQQRKSHDNAGDDNVAVDLKGLDQRQQDDDRKLKGDDVEVRKSDAGNDADEVRWHIAETGLIYFFYRPKVKAAMGEDKGASIDSLDGVQNSFMLLVPRRSESETAPAAPKEEKDGNDDDDDKDKRAPHNPTGFRFIALGRKRMPDVELALSHGQEPRGIGGRDSEATWATISSVGTDLDKLVDGMKESRYSTKTRGERVQPAARPAGRGHYVLSIKQTDPPSNREVRLTYHVSHPSADDFGDVQSEIGIHPSSSVLLQMRNPTMPPTGPDAPTAGLPKEQRAKLTDDEMQQTFGGDLDSGGNRYARPEDPMLLDREGVELLIIKRRNQEKDGLQGAGDEQAKALKDIADRDGKRLSEDEVLEELKLSTKDTEVEALSGEWI